MNSWVLWGIVAAAVIHVAEEYFGDWVLWVQRYAKGVTLRRFVLVNAIFLGLCLGAALSSSDFLLISLAALLFVNALMHIIPTVVLKYYSPGVWSAVLLYIPLSFIAYVAVFRSGVLGMTEVFFATLLGVVFMALPILLRERS
ncbi:MAG: HXXEE domain-containing protein [Pontiellaceae bacterium]|nr:HXXEE domain-containing protein [Pontiellaceae bacterium]